jgi:hypothetical protein
MNSKFGIDIGSSRLRCLRPVLEKWIWLNGDLARRWSAIEDVPWWYRERALLSVFSGAVWLSGGVALEEYTDIKRNRSRRPRSRHSYSGRVDLYFERLEETFIAEAKHIWLPATRHRSQMDKLKNCLDQAICDVKCSSHYGGRRLAIVFVAPYVAIKSADRLNVHVRTLSHGLSPS